MFRRYIALTALEVHVFFNSILLELLINNFETDNVIHLFRILLIEGLPCLKLSLWELYGKRILRL